MKEDLYSSKNILLKSHVDDLINSSIPLQSVTIDEKVILFEDDFHNSQVETIKIFKVLVMLINYNQDKFLGLCIIDISSIVNKISEATSQKVANIQICTFSHELRTPINQALGIVSNIKKGIKDPTQKSNLGMARSSILKLYLRVEEYLYYGKIVSSSFSLNKIQITLNEIFKEIKKMNYEFFVNIFSKKIYFNIDPLQSRAKILIDPRLTLMLIQFFLDKLLARPNNFSIEIRAILHGYNKLAQFIIIEKGKTTLRSRVNIYRNSSQAPKYNNLFNRSDSIESVSEFSKMFMEKVCLILNTQIDTAQVEKDHQSFSFKLDVSRPKKNNDSYAISDQECDEFDIGITGRRGITSNSLRTINIHKKKDIMNHSLPIFPERSTIENSIPIVLCVDDDLMNRYALIGMLKSFEVRIIEAEDGLICLKKYEEISLKEKQKLLILMDLSMPNMDGVTCCTEIRKIEKSQGFPLTPIIAVTGHDSETEKAKALKSGMNEFCIKPLRKSKLKELLNKYLLI